mgnify:CR=1 FL=1
MELQTKIDAFKRYYSITNDINQEFKLQENVLYVWWKTDWVRLSQRRYLDKFYSRSKLNHAYGVCFLRAVLPTDIQIHKRPPTSDIINCAWITNNTKKGCMRLRGYNTHMFCGQHNAIIQSGGSISVACLKCERGTIEDGGICARCIQLFSI